jgi:signal transduction histidine kinase
MPTSGLPQSSPKKEEVDALRRQIIALQRISSLGVLAGSVFHELNNALTPVLSYAKLGLRNPDPAYRERALTRILEAAKRAASITSGMLGLTRPGRGPNHREPMDLVQLVEEVALLLNKDLARNKVRLDMQLAGRAFARVNPAQIQQVLINLLINARQAMPNGGVIKLKLAPDATGRLAELSVIDHGVGIAPENLRRIFEPFFSTKAGPDASGQGGTGLGLSVCRDIVEDHHGRLRAESRLGQGSTFTLILPTCSPPGGAVAEQGAA